MDSGRLFKLFFNSWPVAVHLLLLVLVLVFLGPGSVLAIARESILKEGVTVYEVKILPAKTITVMRSGMTADVRVITDAKQNALFLPKKSIAYKDGEAFVTVKDEPSKKTASKKVETGATNEKAIEILSGLKENDTVYYSTGIAKERSGFNVSSD